MSRAAIQAGGCTGPPLPPGWHKQLLGGVQVSPAKALAGLGLLAGAASLILHDALSSRPGGAGAAIVGLAFGLAGLSKSAGWRDVILAGGVSLLNALLAALELRA